MGDLIAYGLLGFATELAAGKPLPEDITIAPQLVEVVEAIAEQIRNGGAISVSQVRGQLTTYSEGSHWRNFNQTANFLKHADDDLDEILPLDDIATRNHELLSMACVTFMDTIGRSTAEMEAFAVFAYGSQDSFKTPYWNAEYAERFRKATPARRRLLCRRLLKILRERGEHGVLL
jgi:hypothetical protein